MSEIIYPKHPMPFKEAAEGKTFLVIGGGIAAIFTAYEILRQSAKLGRIMPVTILTDKINAPSMAGSHVVLELEGLLKGDVRHKKRINAQLRDGLQRFEDMIEREGIRSRYNQGYEFKAETLKELDDMIASVISKKIYKPHEITINSDDQVFRLPGHDHSARINSIGQINIPDLLYGLLDRIHAMGGHVIMGAKYKGHKNVGDAYVVETTAGTFRSPYKPLLATGAKHQSALPGFNAAAKVIYTMGFVMGPLSEKDAHEISRAPMAFCDTEIDGDVYWGGLDEQRLLTFGYGAVDAPGMKRLEKEMRQTVEGFWGEGFIDKYPPDVCWGPISVLENGLPAVGRLNDARISGFWGSSGITAAFGAANAHARDIVYGRDDRLLVWESMQPQIFGAGRRPANDHFIANGAFTTAQKRGIALH